MVERSILFTVIAAGALLLLVIELVRRRKLREEFSLIWLAVGIGMILLSLSRDLLTQISLAVGIFAPTNLLFLAAILFIFCLLLYLSIVITRLSNENKKIVQEIALLKHERTRLEQTETPHDQQTDEDANQ